MLTYKQYILGKPCNALTFSHSRTYFQHTTLQQNEDNTVRTELQALRNRTLDTARKTLSVHRGGGSGSGGKGGSGGGAVGGNNKRQLLEALQNM